MGYLRCLSQNGETITLAQRSNLARTVASQLGNHALFFVNFGETPLKKTVSYSFHKGNNCTKLQAITYGQSSVWPELDYETVLP